MKISNTEKTNIATFIKCVQEKEYASANKALQSVVNEKIQKTLTTIIKKDYFKDGKRN